MQEMTVIHGRYATVSGQEPSCWDAGLAGELASAGIPRSAG